MLAPRISVEGDHHHESRRWLAQLAPDHPGHAATVARLRVMLHRVAVHEMTRRRDQLPGLAGPEFDDLAAQAANDAVVAIVGKLDGFEGRSQFTTWAYKFVMLEVSRKLARHAWQQHPPSAEQMDLDRLPDDLGALPGDRLDQREQLRALAAGIRELTDRQRQVFVAVALNGLPIDVLAVQSGTNRNAVYKNLFDARRRLRAALATAGYPVDAES